MSSTCPPSRVGHVAAVINDEMLLWGGVAVKEATGDQYACPLDQIECFNLSTSQWNQRRATSSRPSDIPGPCLNARIAVVRNRDIYQFGGDYPASNGRHVYGNDFHKLDGLTFEWQRISPNGPSTATPTGRTEHGLCVLGRRSDEHLVAMGGGGTKIVSPTTEGSLWVAHPVDPNLGYNNEVWLFSLRAREWILAQCVGKQPSPRHGHSFTGVDTDRAILIGGAGPEDELNDAFLFVFSSLVSVPDEVIPTGFQSVCSVVRRGLHFFLRYGGSFHESYDDKPEALLDILKYDFKNSGEDLLYHDTREPIGQYVSKFDTNARKITEKVLCDPSSQIEPHDPVYDEKDDFVGEGACGEVFKATLKKDEEAKTVAVLRSE